MMVMPDDEEVNLARLGYFVLVTGARDWDNEAAMRERLSRYPAGTWLMHGDANGADTMAHLLCRDMHFVEVRVPYIKFLGRAGGPTRNKVMLQILLACKEIRTLRVEAFHTDLRNSLGTKDMVLRAKKAGLKGKITRG
jgi:hypothetical protein